VHFYCHLVLIECIKFALGMSTEFELYILGNGHVLSLFERTSKCGHNIPLKKTASSTLFGISLIVSNLGGFY
jgi:hypothetical protein